MHDFRRGIVRPPDKPSGLLLTFRLAGASFVAIGVAGEFAVHMEASGAKTKMRDGTEELVALADGELLTLNYKLSNCVRILRQRSSARQN